MADKSAGPWWAARDYEKNCGYKVRRLKDLPKLHKAVWKDDLQRVKTVLAGLKKTMYIDYFDKDHRTALHFACARGHDGMVRVICHNGANPNIVDGEGKSPLHKAIESGSYSSVQHLLNVGADPDATDDLGRTALHLAAKVGNIPAIQLLLEGGARTDILENDGLNALKVAAVNNNQEIVQLIRQHPNEGSKVAIEDKLEDSQTASPHNQTSPEVVDGSPLSSDKEESSSCPSSQESSDFELIFDTDDDGSVMDLSCLSSETSCPTSEEEEYVSETSDHPSSEESSDCGCVEWETESPINTQTFVSTGQVPLKKSVSSNVKDRESCQDGNSNIPQCCVEPVPDSVSEISVEDDTSLDDSGPDIIELTDDEFGSIEGNERDKDDELFQKQLILLESFQTLVANTLEVVKEHQLPDLSQRGPSFACHVPVLFKFSDLAIHILSNTNSVSSWSVLNSSSCPDLYMSDAPVCEDLLGVAGKSVALARVNPEEILAADPASTLSFKTLTSRSPMMQLIGLGVIQWIDFEDEWVFVVSPELSSPSVKEKVNTIVIGTPKYPENGELFHNWPPQTQTNKPSEHQDLEKTPHRVHSVDYTPQSQAPPPPPSSQPLTQSTNQVTGPPPPSQPLTQSTNQPSGPPPPTLPPRQHSRMPNFYPTLSRPLLAYCPPTHTYRAPGPYNYPPQAYQAQHVPRPHHPHAPPSYPHPAGFNTMHSGSRYPTPSHQSHTPSHQSHTPSHQSNSTAQEQPTQASLSHLLRLLQLPPRFRAEEWFTSI